MEKPPAERSEAGDNLGKSCGKREDVPARLWKTCGKIGGNSPLKAPSAEGGLAKIYIFRIGAFKERVFPIFSIRFSPVGQRTFPLFPSVFPQVIPSLASLGWGLFHRLSPALKNQGVLFVFFKNVFSVFYEVHPESSSHWHIFPGSPPGQYNLTHSTLPGLGLPRVFWHCLPTRDPLPG